MKKIFKSRIKLLIPFIGLMLVVGSCEYQEIADTAWPEQLIYMPAALYNNYTIDAVPSARGVSPTPGYPTRFLVDTVQRKFNVLLGVYRSGITTEGSFTVDVAVNTDTITKLLALPGKLPAATKLLATDKYTIPNSVQVKDGDEVVGFELAVNLDSLLANYVITTGKNYALAVGISSSARKTNPLYATTIIVINTKIMKPTAAFTSAPSGTNPRTINFTNTSVNGTRFIWDFGDGSANRVTTAAKNETVSYTYAAAGTYTIKLTVQGVGDWAQRSVFTAVRVIP